VRTLIQDLRFGFRMALRSPLHSDAVLTLAAGMRQFHGFQLDRRRPPASGTGCDRPARLVAFETVAPNGDALLTSYPIIGITAII